MDLTKCVVDYCQKKQKGARQTFRFLSTGSRKTLVYASYKTYRELLPNEAHEKICCVSPLYIALIGKRCGSMNLHCRVYCKHLSNTLAALLRAYIARVSI
jgi:hypothetical protein